MFKIKFIHLMVLYAVLGCYKSSSAPVQMPSVYDRTAVKLLIEQVEKPSAMTALKIGYFMRRTRHPLPIQEGFSLIKNAASQEKRGTKRWFSLNSIVGFAAFRLPQPALSDGFTAYNSIFDEASKAIAIGSEYPLRKAMDEFALDALGLFSTQSLINSDPRVRVTFIKAWKAYAIYAQLAGIGVDGKDKFKLSEPKWGHVLGNLGVWPEIVKATETLLKNPRLPQTYQIFTTSAYIIETVDHDRGITLLRAAEKLLPQDDSQEVHEYYGALIEWVAPYGQKDINRLKQAVVLQQNYTKITKKGHGKLAVFMILTNDKIGLQQLISSMEQPDADASEINSVARSLAEIGIEQGTSTQKANGVEQSEALLLSYLKSDRTREIDQELQARLTLAKSLKRRAKLQEARAVLMASPVSHPDPTPTTKELADDIQKLLMSINPS